MFRNNKIEIFIFLYKYFIDIINREILLFVLIFMFVFIYKWLYYYMILKNLRVLFLVGLLRIENIYKIREG